MRPSSTAETARRDRRFPSRPGKVKTPPKADTDTARFAGCPGYTSFITLSARLDRGKHTGPSVGDFDGDRTFPDEDRPEASKTALYFQYPDFFSFIYARVVCEKKRVYSTECYGGRIHVMLGSGWCTYVRFNLFNLFNEPALCRCQLLNKTSDDKDDAK